MFQFWRYVLALVLALTSNSPFQQLPGTVQATTAVNFSQRSVIFLDGINADGPYTLTLSATAGGTAASSTPGPYAPGTALVLTATAAVGFTFSGWTVDGTPGGTTNPRTLVMNTSHTVVAHFTPVPPPLPQAYRFTYLGTLGGTDSYGLGLNDAGQAVGFSSTANPVAHGFRWQGGALTDLGTLSGGGSSFANGINAQGQVVGDAVTANGAYHAFFWQDGAMTDLATLPGYTGSVAQGINAAGQIVGASDRAFSNPRATVWLGNTMSDLGTLGGSTSMAYAINETGQIVGWAETAGGARHAVLWHNGTMTDLGTLGGAASFAYAINAHGQVVGAADTASGVRHAFLWQYGTMTDLGTLPGKASSEAKGINDQGTIVGNAYDDPEFPTPFVYSNGTIASLNGLRAPETTGSVYSAEGINNVGQIICEGWYFQGNNGYGGAQLLTPVSESLLTITPASANLAMTSPTHICTQCWQRRRIATLMDGGRTGGCRPGAD